MGLKKWFFRSTILIPILAVCYTFSEPVRIYIREIGFEIFPFDLCRMFLVLTMLWICCSPVGNGCKGCGKYELFFYTVPAAFLLLLVFAQYHCMIALIIGIGIAGLSLSFRYFLWKKSLEEDFDKKKKRQYLIAGRRFFVQTVFVLSFIPSVMAVFVYNLKDPRYEARMELLEELTESRAEDETAEQPDMSFLKEFDEEKWSAYSVEQKVTLLQCLADFEAEKLGIPSLPVYAERRENFELASYNPELQCIFVDIEHLEADVSEVSKTLLHEVFHSMQEYTIRNIDWESEFSASGYFAEAREWKYESEHYISGRGVGNYDAYATQALEESAREFSKKEYETLVPYMEE